MSSCYDTLGIPATATRDQIRSAYRSACRRTHPDMGGDPQDFIKVTEAYKHALLLDTYSQPAPTATTATTSTFTAPPPAAQDTYTAQQEHTTAGQQQPTPSRSTTGRKFTWRPKTMRWRLPFHIPQTVQVLMWLTIGITVFIYQQMLTSVSDPRDMHLLMSWSHDHSAGLPTPVAAFGWLFLCTFTLLAAFRVLRVPWVYTVVLTVAPLFFIAGQMAIGVLLLAALVCWLWLRCRFAAL